LKCQHQSKQNNTIKKTLNLIPQITKPQPHENHTHRFPTLATAYPQGMRQLPKARPFRNHP